MKKKLLALFLALTMAVSLVTPAFAAGGMVTSPSEVLASTPVGRAALLSAWDFEVFQKDDLDKAVEEATVNLFEKTQIMLGELDIPGVDFQWQIAVPDQDLWVDIQGEDKLGLDLSYAKVASLLNEDGEAQVRCEVSLGSLVFQGPIITVDVDEDAKPEPTPVKHKKPVVLKGPEVVIHDSQPAEPEEPEAEEPAPEAPVVPPVQQEPEVVPEVVPEEPVVVPEEPATELDRSALEESVVAVYNHRNKPLSASTKMVVADLEDTYTFEIRYQLWDGSTVAASELASIGKNTKYTSTVKNPVVEGYIATVDKANLPEGVGVSVVDATSATDSGSITFETASMTGDVTVTVVYQPTTVNYTVKYYQQNVDDDGYTEVEEDRDTLTGTTNEVVADVSGYDKKYPGFYGLRYAKPVIAADGSTVVEIKYDRYYRLMTFDLGGGYGVEPIYARFGADLGDVPTPTKAGYTFGGWSATKGGTTAVELPDTMPAVNTTYYAIWTPNDKAKVTIVFWGENADDELYSYIDSAELYLTPDTEFTYSEEGLLTCGKEAHTHDGCEYGCEQEVHSHSIDEGCYKISCNIVSHNHGDSGCVLSCSHPKHELECYQTRTLYTLKQATPGQTIQTSGDGVYSYNTREWYRTETHYYLYLSGVWYCYYGNISGDKKDTQSIYLDCNHTHVDACYSCGQTEGTHIHSLENNCYTLICTKGEHNHSEQCYACGKVSHSHSSDCYTDNAGLDSSRWFFKSSETKTVAADGSTVVNVYYDRVEYTVNFYTNSDLRTEYTNYRITAKWGANILNNWPTHEGSSSWYVAGKSSTWQNSIQIMPVGGAKFYGPKSGSSNYKAYYYVEALPGDTDTFERNDVTYKLHHFDTSSSSGNVTDEERYGIEGFTYKEGTANGESYNNAKFYYIRNVYDIKFYNPTDLIKTENDVPYESNLGTYDFTPTADRAPAKYEPGSVVFEGWYLNPECTGEEYILSEQTMPVCPENEDGEAALSLYAKWVPVTYTVEFYLNKAAMEAGNKYYPDATVAHGTKVTPEPKDPANGSYIFVEWFYEDENGDEKPFDFANMPVKKSMKVYGKWSSNTVLPYTIYYKDQATGKEIADRTTGSDLAGTTITFDAKGGDELYKDYREGYFPVFQSHSLIIDINATEGNDTNVYTFEYVQKDAVPYIVRYVDEAGNALSTEKVVADNRFAVVTENAALISGKLPDEYQKRLVVNGSDTLEEGQQWIQVTVEGESINVHPDNVITFVYKTDTEHAYYTVTHYIEALNGGWEQHSFYANQGIIGQPYSAEPLSLTGFAYDPTVEGSLAKGTLTKNGLDLKFYYTRKTYNYTINYLDIDTYLNLLDPIESTVAEKYGYVVKLGSDIEIKEFDGYDYVKMDPSVLMIGTDPSKNVATLYYREKPVIINYEVVGPANSGTVVLNSDTSTPGASATETIKVLSGKAVGATAAVAGDDYRFVGWYSDAACEKPVDTTWVTDNKITPAKVNGKNVAATYYAKFVEKEVTINYEVVGATGCGSVSPASETVKVLSGTAQGSTAKANSGYRFVGWYSDAECTGDAISTNANFVPAKVDGKNVAATYYAKFVEKQVTINYVAVGSGGSVAPASEELNVITGNAAGSAATVTDPTNYEFVGWFTDEECQNAVVEADGTLSNDGKDFVPAKENNGQYAAATFYAKFQEKAVTINYAVVGPEGCGTVSPTSETVNAVTGTANGSTASATSNVYKFVGWYDNANCTGTAVSTNAEFVPTKTEGTAWVDGTTYYAKFEYNLTSLTITKAAAKDTTIDPNQTFIFNVKGDGVDMDVVITGTGSVTIDGLTVGASYTVTEKTDWSWRYDQKSVSGLTNGAITLEVSDNEVTFTNEKTNSKWLSAVTKVINTWTNSGISQDPAPTSGTTK